MLSHFVKTLLDQTRGRLLDKCLPCLCQMEGMRRRAGFFRTHVRGLRGGGPKEISKGVIGGPDLNFPPPQCYQPHPAWTLESAPPTAYKYCVNNLTLLSFNKSMITLTTPCISLDDPNLSSVDPYKQRRLNEQETSQIKYRYKIFYRARYYIFLASDWLIISNLGL